MALTIEKLTHIDRRIIFVLIALSVFILLLFPLYIKIKPTPEVKAIYNTIESLPAGSAIFMSLDFDPASKPELYPMVEAILRHSFKRNLKVIGMTLWPTGAGMGETAFTDISKEFGKKYGEDYLYLGWQPGDVAVIIGLSENISETFRKDHFGNNTEGMPILEQVKSLKQVDYMMEFAAGSSIGAWYFYGKMPCKFKMGGGCTGVSAAEWYNLVKIDWINGFLGGLRGAAEYEVLLNHKGFAMAGMDAQSITHILIIGLILFSNLLLFINKKK